MTKKIQIAIDSPAASGAGTQAKLLSKYFNLFYLDTGKLYRILGKIYLSNSQKIDLRLFKNKISETKLTDLKSKKLLSNEIGLAAAHLAKIKKIRIFVTKFQKDLARNPPKNFRGSCFDGRDITYNIMPNADVKFFLEANLNIRVRRRFLELKKLGYKTSYKEVYKIIKKRDKSDYSRKESPLKKTTDAIKINTSKLTIKECNKKMKKYIEKCLNKK